MKLFLLTLSVLIIGECCLSGQDTLSNGNALNIPFRKYGISIGNSYEFTGIRFNFAERDVRRINGMNLTLWSRFKFIYNEDEIVNGISVGTIASAMKLNGVNIFILGGVTSQSLNGLSIGGIGCGSENVNGISIGGLYQGGGTINGLSLSGAFSNAGKRYNGIAVAVLAPLTEGDINGIACGVLGIYSGGFIRGIAVTPGYLQAGNTEGLSIAGFVNIGQVHGLSIAIFNSAKELHGVQAGVLNYARNNRKGLKFLPLINMHF